MLCQGCKDRWRDCRRLDKGLSAGKSVRFVVSVEDLVVCLGRRKP